jgi:hypothetical protein
MGTATAPTTLKTELVDVGAESTYWPDRKPLRLGVALHSGLEDGQYVSSPMKTRTNCLSTSAGSAVGSFSRAVTSSSDGRVNSPDPVPRSSPTAGQ